MMVRLPQNGLFRLNRKWSRHFLFSPQFTVGSRVHLALECIGFKNHVIVPSPHVLQRCVFMALFQAEIHSRAFTSCSFIAKDTMPLHVTA